MGIILGERGVVVGGQRSLWDEIFRRLRLKGLQMEMILGKREV